MAEITLLFNLKLIDAESKIIKMRLARAKKGLDVLAKYCSTSLLKELRELFIAAFPQLAKMKCFDITFVGMYIGFVSLI